MRNVLARGTRPFLVALALLAAPLGAAALAQQPDLSGVQITPARLEQDLSGRAFRIPIRLDNHMDSAQTISLSVSGLGHDLSGSPLFLEPAIATDAIELSAQEVVLAPGATRQVFAVGEIPEGPPSLYASVLAEFAPTDGANEGQITSRSRVASLILLRGPKPWEEKLEIVDVSILPGPDKDPLQVYAAVKNIGNVHVMPTGSVRLVKDGKTLDTVDLPGQNVIPDYARRLSGAWKPPKKLTGRIKLVANTVGPAARAIGYVDFTPKGELAVPGMQISNMVARDDDGPSVEFALTNTGTIPLAPTISLSVTQEDAVIAEKSIEQPRMEPESSEVIQWRPEGLEEGVFLISAEVSYREQLLDQASAGLKLEPKKTPLWVFLVGGGVLLLLLLALVLFFGRRKKKAKEESPREPEAEAA